MGSISKEEYYVERLHDNTYLASVDLKNCGGRVEIPEEYNGVPITVLRICYAPSETVNTIIISKNIKIIVNAVSVKHDEAMPYFVEISPENPWLCADDKTVFSKDKKILYAFTARGDESYTVPDTVEEIRRFAFSGFRMKELILPDSLECLDNDCITEFEADLLKFPRKIKNMGWRCVSCTNAGSIVLPESVEKMQTGCFFDFRVLSAVYLPDVYCDPNADIPNYELTSEYIIDENSKTLVQIDGVIYTKDMKALLAVTRKAPAVIEVPEGVEIIAASACKNNDNIKEIHLPVSLHMILNNAFKFSSLEKINLENVKNIGINAFYYCKKLAETGKIGAENIEAAAFCYCRSLGNVILTKARTIGSCAFHNLMDGVRISLPEGLESVGSRALCSKMNRIRIPSTVKNIVELPDCLEAIELYDTGANAEYLKRNMCLFYENNCVIKVLSRESKEVICAVTNFRDPGFLQFLWGEEHLFDLEKYDKCFKNYSVCFDYGHVSVGGSLLKYFEAAHYRIKYPFELTDEMRELYTQFLEKHSAAVIRQMLEQPNITAERISDLPYLYAVPEAELTEFIKLSAKQKLTGITALLMNFKNEHYPTGGEANKP